MLESAKTEGLPIRDILNAFPLAIAQYIAVTMQGGNRRHQFAAAEAILRQLGLNFLSASYDRAGIGNMFGCGNASEDAPEAQ